MNTLACVDTFSIYDDKFSNDSSTLNFYAFCSNSMSGDLLLLFFYFSFVAIIYNKATKKITINCNPPEFLAPVFGLFSLFFVNLFINIINRSRSHRWRPRTNICRRKSRLIINLTNPFEAIVPYHRFWICQATKNVEGSRQNFKHIQRSCRCCRSSACCAWPSRFAQRNRQHG